MLRWEVTDLIYASEGFTTRPPSPPWPLGGRGAQTTRMLPYVQGPLSVWIVAIQPLWPLSLLWSLLGMAIDGNGCLSVRLMDLTGRGHG